MLSQWVSLIRFQAPLVTATESRIGSLSPPPVSTQLNKCAVNSPSVWVCARNQQALLIRLRGCPGAHPRESPPDWGAAGVYLCFLGGRDSATPGSVWFCLRGWGRQTRWGLGRIFVGGEKRGSSFRQRQTLNSGRHRERWARVYLSITKWPQSSFPVPLWLSSSSFVLSSGSDCSSLEGSP